MIMHGRKWSKAKLVTRNDQPLDQVLDKATGAGIRVASLRILCIKKQSKEKFCMRIDSISCS